MISSHLASMNFRRTELPSVSWRAAVDALDEWNEVRIWRDPDGIGFIGIGVARVFDSPVFHQNVRRFREFAGEISDVAVPAFVASAFAPQAESAPEWEAFRRCEVVVPRATVAFDGDRASLFLCGSASEIGGLEDRIRTLLASAHHEDASVISSLEFEWGDAQFRARVDAALERLSSSRNLEKVVVARHLAVSAPRSWRTPETLARLSRQYPDCFEFALRRGEATFLGATPERLVRVRDRKATTGALAGSARRGTASDEDRRLAAALLESKKDRDEHDVVTRMITSKLEPLSTSVDAPTTPELMKLSNVQHLFTPIQAELSEGVGIGEVARRLHPTPAVGGMPRAEAQSAIRELEDFDRGLYAGFLGWVNSNGDGDLSVSLR
ncbi:MAG: isochorismate synthase, partial [Myxococcota bacterium]